jgi:hypothetical protein
MKVFVLEHLTLVQTLNLQLSHQKVKPGDIKMRLSNIILVKEVLSAPIISKTDFFSTKIFILNDEKHFLQLKKSFQTTGLKGIRKVTDGVHTK